MKKTRHPVTRIPGAQSRTASTLSAMRRKVSRNWAFGTRPCFVSITHSPCGVATRWSMSPTLATSSTWCATAHDSTTRTRWSTPALGVDPTPPRAPRPRRIATRSQWPRARLRPPLGQEASREATRRDSVSFCLPRSVLRRRCWRLTHLFADAPTLPKPAPPTYSGGTSHTLRIAAELGIPTVNLSPRTPPGHNAAALAAVPDIVRVTILDQLPALPR